MFPTLDFDDMIQDLLQEYSFDIVYSKLVEFNEGIQKDFEAQEEKIVVPLTDDVILIDFISFRDE